MAISVSQPNSLLIVNVPGMLSRWSANVKHRSAKRPEPVPTDSQEMSSDPERRLLNLVSSRAKEKAQQSPTCQRRHDVSAMTRNHNRNNSCRMR